MKINIGYLGLMAALSPTASAWSFYANGKTIVRDQDLDVPCDKISLKKGSKISWYEAYWETCEIQLFEDSKCNNWAGGAKQEWKNHKLGQSVGSYSVRC